MQEKAGRNNNELDSKVFVRYNEGVKSLQRIHKRKRPASHTLEHRLWASRLVYQAARATIH